MFGLSFNSFLYPNGYYVKEFNIPSDFNCENIILSIGYCDDRCEVYLNGKRIGAKGINADGSLPSGTFWDKSYEVTITQNDINRGGKNILMVIQWILMPVTSILYQSVAAFYSQTRLMLGKYMEKFDVTKKVVKT